MIRFPRLRFSLRTLVIFVLLCASGFGLWWRWGPPWEPAWVCTASGDLSNFEYEKRGRSADGKYRLETEGDHNRVADFLGRMICTLPRGHAAISPDGRKVAVACDSVIGIYEVPAGTLIRELAGHSDYVADGEFSADSKLLVTASSDKTARIWNVETGDLIASLPGHSYPVSQASFSPDAARVLTVSGDDLGIWGARSGYQLAILKAAFYMGTPIDGAAFSRDGIEVVAMNEHGQMFFWRRRHPECWWGLVWLWEFWAVLVFGVGLVWSVGRDRQMMRKAAA